MCIEVHEKQVVKNGELKLWKVIRKDDIIGLWGETDRLNVKNKRYQLGDNCPHEFISDYFQHAVGQFHCFFTRKDARNYRKMHQRRAIYWPTSDPMGKTKIIRVFAHSTDVVAVGRDKQSNLRALSVSKMEIKSLKHQR